ncbi:hypothetical protein O6H91_03G015500 [Diphasiastrum complanatum]|uniref:Uncharacterized protein n=1 Tax=Diphasiastrum complanatum TaxID=34168 RepID=A0ACC2E4C0_DIPCM|nr:hypothetical protein O6H91_03G015500 [Diphasiastrum complanatum]
METGQLQASENGHSGVELEGIAKLRVLFSEQKKYLDYFFDHLDYPQLYGFTKLLLECKGVIFFSGVGKSGFIAQKISQTLVSTGTKSVFLNPTDALHGDIGIVGPEDIVVIFSKSGATEELLKLVPCAKAKGAFLVSVSSLANSVLGKLSDMNVFLPLERELCPFDLAPVTSTAIQMLFGDTVAIALMQAKNLTREQYALNHPAGRIGKRLILRVQDVMKKGAALPLCKDSDMIMDQLVELSAKGCGCLLIVDEKKRLVGTFTDGDLRRSLNEFGDKLFNMSVGELCTRSPRTVLFNSMAVDAMTKMEKTPPVKFLPIVNHANVVVGLVTLHDLVSAGL